MANKFIPTWEDRKHLAEIFADHTELPNPVTAAFFDALLQVAKEGYFMAKAEELGK